MRIVTCFPLAIFIVVFLGYIPALDVGFYSDDYGFTPLYILKPSEMLKAMQMAHIGLLNLHPFRPTGFFSFLIDYNLHGFEPTGFHLTNIIIHSCNTVLLFTLTKEISKNLWISMVAALFFGFYPGNIEAVVWVSGRFDLLAGFWFLITVLLWLKSINDNSKWLIPVSGLTFLFSLFAKEVAISGIFIFPALVGCFGSFREQKHKLWLIYSVAAVILFLSIRFWIFGNLAGDTFSTRGGLTERLDFDLLSFNFQQDLRLLMTPFNRTCNNELDWYFYIGYGLLLALALVGTLIRSAENERCRLFIGLLWTAGFILPALVMDEVRETLDNARFLYLPSMGFGLLISLSIRKDSRLFTYCAVIVLMVVLLLNLVTLQNNIKPWIEHSDLTCRIDTIVANEISLREENQREDLTVILLNTPQIVQGVHISPVPYTPYFDFLKRIKIHRVTYTRIEPTAIPDWYTTLKRRNGRYLVFVFEEETSRFYPLSSLQP